MSTTGYGDILPKTNWERSYALCIMLVGVVVSALVFGVLAQIITEAFDHLPTGTQHQSEVWWPRCGTNSFLQTLAHSIFATQHLDI
jgi:Ion channel